MPKRVRASGLELLLPLALKWASTGRPGRDARANFSVTSAPAAVLGAALGTLQASCGRLVEGGLADLCVFDPQARWVACRPRCAAAASTPFAGYELTGRVRSTLVGGHFAHGA